MPKGGDRSWAISYKHDGATRDNGSVSRLYTIYTNMRQRCLNPECPAYQLYGARGVSICPEWDDYSEFRSWAVGAGYSDDLTIDRVDNDGDYTPENCRWVTMKEQTRNQRRNRLVEFGGEEMVLADWADVLGISYKTLHTRLTRGWSIERAFTTGVKK